MSSIFSSTRGLNLIGILIFFLYQPAFAQPNYPRNPEQAKLIYSDLINFTKAYKALETDSDTVQVLQTLYFDRGSDGLKEFVNRHQLTPQLLKDAMMAHPQRYALIPGFLENVEEVEVQFKDLMQKYHKVMPDAMYAPTYLLVGANRGIGQASLAGQLITLTRVVDDTEKLQKLIAHELTHFQQAMAMGGQKYQSLYSSPGNMLGLCLREGGAEFITSLVLGDITQTKALDYLDANEPSWRAQRNYKAYQVVSCWGGLTVFPGDIFQKLGVRFRSSFPLECAASECELLPRDLWASNRSHIVLMPSVQVTYTASEFHRITTMMHAVKPGTVSVWDPALVSEFETTRPASLVCCPLEDNDTRDVDTSHCYNDPVWWWYELFGVPLASEPSLLTAAPTKHDPHTATLDLLLQHTRMTSGQQCGGLLPVPIPRTVIQLWHHTDITRMRLHLSNAVLSWIRVNPCFKFRLLAYHEMDSWVAEQSPSLSPTFSSLPLPSKINVFRLLYLAEHGGIFPAIDTTAIQPLEPLLHPHTRFLGGLESDLKDSSSWLADWYAAPKSVGLSVLASEPSGVVVTQTLERIWALLSDPRPVYQEVRRRTRGTVSALIRMLTTGQGPLTAVLFDNPQHLPADSANVLGLYQLNGVHPPLGPVFIEEMRSGHSEEVTVKWEQYVSSRHLVETWFPRSRVVGRMESRVLHSLQTEVPWLSGQVLLATPTTATDQTILWASQFAGNTQQGEFFAWLRSSSDYYGHPDQHTSTKSFNNEAGMGDGRKGCLEVLSGYGPSDSNANVVWSACWPANEELGDVFALPSETGQLVVYTMKNRWCDGTRQAQYASGNSTDHEFETEESGPDWRVLWRSDNAPSLGKSTFRVSVSESGQLMLGRVMNEPKVAHPDNDVTVQPCPSDHILSTVSFSDQTEFELASSACNLNPQCVSLVCMRGSASGGMKRKFECTLCDIPLPHEPGGDQIYAIKKGLVPLSEWVRTTRNVCSATHFRQTGRVNSLYEARLLCDRDPACVCVNVRSSITSTSEERSFSVSTHSGVEGLDGVFSTVASEGPVGSFVRSKVFPIREDKQSLSVEMQCLLGWAKPKTRLWKMCVKFIPLWDVVLRRLQTCP